jgi:hypothetical protein
LRVRALQEIQGAELMAKHPHIIEGAFQSDKYPACPRGKFPMSFGDLDAQPLLWEYARLHETRDPELAIDMREALRLKGYTGPPAPSEHSTPGLERISDLLEPLAAYALQQLEARDEYDRQRQRDYRTYKLKSQPGGTCCYCDAPNVTLLIRGTTIFGCTACVPPFLRGLEGK